MIQSSSLQAIDKSQDAVGWAYFYRPRCLLYDSWVASQIENEAVGLRALQEMQQASDYSRRRSLR